MHDASPTTLEGVLEVRRTGTGSKGEMLRTVLVPACAPGDDTIADDDVEARTPRAIPVRMHGATRLDADPALDAWLGCAVRLHGRYAFATFVVERIEAC
jgi:hypothetical protein